ncbi:MAG: hypothetical protein J5677_00190, partial [Bacteroidales bacterium]|nr:hypothetical protein [Bacteroidales bacterium]
KQRFGINDAYRGTVGTVIGYEWRGKWCLRSRPLRVHNPRTAKQQANRQLFKQMVALAGTIKLALRKGLHSVSLAMHVTECNLFVKRNKERFSLDGDGKMAVDWEHLIISEGELTSPEFQVATNLSAFHFPFSTSCGSGDDEVYVYAYCPEMEEGVLSAAAWRRMGCVTLALPERWQGKEVHLYGFAVSYEGEASATVYIGSLVRDTTPDTINVSVSRYEGVERKEKGYGTERNPQGPRLYEKRAETQCIRCHEGDLRDFSYTDT